MSNFKANEKDRFNVAIIILLVGINGLIIANELSNKNEEISQLNTVVYEKNETILDLQNTIRLMELDINTLCDKIDESRE